VTRKRVVYDALLDQRQWKVAPGSAAPPPLAASVVTTGTILGALILSVLNSMLTFLNVGQAIQQVVYGVIVLALAWGYAGFIRRA